MTQFICNTDERYRSACEGLPEYRDTGFCVLHSPDENKQHDFKEALEQKLARREYDFGGTLFPKGTSEFQRFTFDANVSFAGAVFWGIANFQDAKFSSTDTFSSTYFTGATFHGEANFWLAEFKDNDTYFAQAKFNGNTNFSRTIFSGRDVSFDGAEFSQTSDKTDFSQATFCTRGWTSFSEAKFFNAKRTDFASAKFNAKTSFHSARFRHGVDFFSAEFTAQTVFTSAAFSNGVGFRYTKFRNDEVLFPGTEFGGLTEFLNAEFSAKVNFTEAKFSGAANFSPCNFTMEIDLTGANFESDADFRDAHFKNATFEKATFQRGADFTGANFNGTRERTTDFRRATFGGELYFREAEFNGYTDFYRTNFLDAVKFIGRGKEDEEDEEPDSVSSNGDEKEGTEKQDTEKEDKEQPPVFAPNGQVSFTRARIEKPELFSFDTVQLRPSWLVGVDARKFDFTAVEWYGLPNGPAGSVDDEIERVRQKEKGRSPYTLMAQACQRLATNAEENRNYPTANELHYWSMEAQRKEAAGSNFAPWRLIWWYWVLSGYGERQVRAGMWVLGILFGFAALYLWVGPLTVQIEQYSLVGILQAASEAVVYSLGVMTRLASDVPESASIAAKSLVIIEGVLGPLQIGLFLLALRREFMR